jgi:hypothetical protein
VQDKSFVYEVILISYSYVNSFVLFISVHFSICSYVTVLP